jgi:hypothetical protein
MKINGNQIGIWKVIVRVTAGIVPPRICLESLKKNAKYLSHDSQNPNQDLNQVPPEYKS